MTRTLLIILTFAFFNLRTTTNSGRPLPTIFFNENSTSYSSFKSSTEIYTDTLDILNYITKIMVEDSTMRIQISGHADTEERHPKKVALLRVKKVYEDLKRIGADTSRLSFIIYGDSRQLVSKKMMKRCRQESNSKSCFDQLRQMNRRVGFNWTRVTSPNRSYK